MSIVTINVQPRVEKVEIVDERLSVNITDGRVVSVPLSWYPRLFYANKAERSNWRIFEDSNGRDVIFWEDIDELIPVIALLDGTPSRESQKSFERWLSGRT